MHFSSIIITNTGWLLDKPRERARAKTHSGPRRLIICIIYYRIISFVLSTSVFCFPLLFFLFLYLPNNYLLPFYTFQFLSFLFFFLTTYRLIISGFFVWVDDARLFHDYIICSYNVFIISYCVIFFVVFPLTIDNYKFVSSTLKPLIYRSSLSFFLSFFLFS